MMSDELPDSSSVQEHELVMSFDTSCGKQFGQDVVLVSSALTWWYVWIYSRMPLASGHMAGHPVAQTLCSTELGRPDALISMSIVADSSLQQLFVKWRLTSNEH